ncbi:MAG: hypothetical protein HY937_03410 [Nitrosomonadales bacterium]|nr:hypothetical protein [Nitrosomonadales bacterium]
MSLENLGKIFDALSRGRHISSVDGDLFESLNKAPSEYRALFKDLCFEMIASSRGYYYFDGSSRGLSKSVNRIALFVYIFMDHSADQGEGITDAVGKGLHSLSAQPHLSSERYRRYMKQVGVETVEHLSDILRQMDNLGFARKLDEDQFTFLPPIYRIIEACEAVNPAYSEENEEPTGEVTTHE